MADIRIAPASLTPDEQRMIALYRQLSLWDRRAFHMLIQSCTTGGLDQKTDRWDWNRLRKECELPAGTEAAKESNHV